MDIKEEKIALAKKILDTDDESVLQNIKAILNGVDVDWWNDLPDDAKASIDKGLEESSRGELFMTDEVMKTIQ